MEHLRNLYIGLVLAALAAPLLCVTGPAGIRQVAGFERQAPRPRSPRKPSSTARSERPQGSTTAGFGRGELLKFKHLVFDAVNLGHYRRYSGNVVQGRDGFLFERGYLDVLFNPPTKYHTPAHRRQFAETAAALQRAVEARRRRLRPHPRPKQAGGLPGLVPAATAASAVHQPTSTSTAAYPTLSPRPGSRT